MDMQELDRAVKELRELRRMAKELEKEMGAAEERIKGEMEARETEVLEGPDWKVTWKRVTSSRLDGAALRKELPEIAARFTKQSTVRRFLLS